MQAKSRWLGRVVTAVVASITATAGLSVFAVTSSHALSSFTFTRLGGTDRYQTADIVQKRAFPSGIATVVLADALPANNPCSTSGHQPDDLAASGYEGVNAEGILLTDCTNTVPANTMTALSNNGVRNIVAVGGPAAVSAAQVSALKAAGFNVTQPFQGATRFDTMQMMDDAIPPASVGSSGGLKTAILASGNDNHLIDALSAGGTAYLDKFPVILTDTTSSTLSPQAQNVISTLGIKKLIVVGGPAAVPTSQYSPAPSGITTVDTAATSGADRSATSKLFADDALSNYGLTNPPTDMVVATGATFFGTTSTLQNDGADALSSAPFAGLDKSATLVTNGPTDVGSVPAWATEHASSLDPGYAIGGPKVLTDAQLQQIAQAAGGNFQAGHVSVNQTSSAAGGTVTGTVVEPVSALTVSGCGFSNQSVTPDSNGNFSITVPSGASAGNCNLTFTATTSSGTVTTTVPFTVSSGTPASCSAGPSSLPVLCSASIVSTTTASQATASNAAGTVVQFVFSKSLSGAAFQSSGFFVWPASDNAPTGARGATGGFEATDVGAPGGGICGIAACAPSTNPNAVNVLFGDASLQTTTGAAGLTLATVAGPKDGAVGPAVTLTTGAVNPSGAAPIGTAVTSTPTAGVTKAPNLESIATPRAASANSSSAIDLTFDMPAFPQPAGAGATSPVDGNQYYDLVFSTGASSPAFGAAAAPGAAAGSSNYVANTGGMEETCIGPQAANPTNTGSSLSVPGYNPVNSTVTIVCGDSPTTPTTTLTAGQIARIVVESAAVGSAAPGSSSDVTNDMQVSDSPHGSASPSPSLSSLTLTPGTSGTTQPDIAVFTFDTGVTNVNPAGFFLISQGANVAAAADSGADAAGGNVQGGGGPCITGAPAATPGCQVTSTTSSTQVALYFANGTLKNNAIVGGNVVDGSVSNSNAATVDNGDDELGATNSAATSLSPGTINAPQLVSASVTTSTNAFGATSYTAKWVFNEAVTVTGAVNANFHAYDADGTELICAAPTQAANGGTGANDTTVSCPGSQMQIATVPGVPSGTAATATQLAGITWSSVDYNAVIGNNTAGVQNQAPNNNPNPEGAAAG